jgi:preprotein translocase subunit SecD
MSALMRIIFLAFALTCLAAQSNVNQPGIKLEFRLAENAPAEGLTEATIPRSDTKIYLHKEAIVTNSVILDARVIYDRYSVSFNIEISFTGEGAERLAKATLEHIGKPLAVLFDGKVVTAPVVMSKISGNGVITGGFAKEVAERIAAGIKKQ